MEKPKGLLVLYLSIEYNHSGCQHTLEQNKDDYNTF